MGISEIQEHLEGICAEIESLPAIPEDAMTYPELKMQLMVNYVSNLAYYIALKHRGVKNIASGHPVFAHLAYLRTFMERLVPMDASLKYQIDKLLMEIDNEVVDGKTTTEEGSAGPNLAAFVPSAVKRITADQVVKQQGIMVENQQSSRLEIDPSLIAEQIRNAQASVAGKKRRRKVKTYVEEDSEKGSEIDEAEFEPTKSSGKSRVAKRVKLDDDEEIDSDDSDI